MRTLKVISILLVAAGVLGCGQGVSQEESIAPQLESAFGKGDHK